MKRILFVDDEPSILDGLKRMLRSQRKVWGMSFAGSGPQALEVLGAEPFDVIVTDMKMPGMNGAELLKHVQERHPATIRIVLSGHADMEASMRSVAVSHQFLAKPCEAEQLKSVVERACCLDVLLRDRQLTEILGQVSDLPVLPRVYHALTDALSKEEADLGDVGAIVEQDSGIASKILQLVNSSFFGIRREIVDIRQATSFLGITTIRDLVLSFGMFSAFDLADSRFSIEREQEMSFAASRIARRLLPDANAAGLAFLAAMLHGSGKLVLASRFREDFVKVLGLGGGLTRPLDEVEREVLGVSHTEIGAYLLGLWGMPYPVVEAVAHHLHPSQVGGEVSFGVLGAVHVAVALAHEQFDESNSLSVDEAYLEQCGVLDQLPEWRAMAVEEATQESASTAEGA